MPVDEENIISLPDVIITLQISQALNAKSKVLTLIFFYYEKILK
jgi:hypothetical protein